MAGRYRSESLSTLSVNSARNVVALIHRDRVFRFRRPVNIHVYQEGNLWIHEYEPLGISAYGSSETESLRAFAEEFSSCWRWIAMEQDSGLAADAQQLKRQLLDLVEAVQSADELDPLSEAKKRAVR